MQIDRLEDKKKIEIENNLFRLEAEADANLTLGEFTVNNVTALTKDIISKPGETLFDAASFLVSTKFGPFGTLAVGVLKGLFNFGGPSFEDILMDSLNRIEGKIDYAINLLEVNFEKINLKLDELPSRFSAILRERDFALLRYSSGYTFLMSAITAEFIQLNKIQFEEYLSEVKKLNTEYATLRAERLTAFYDSLADQIQTMNNNLFMKTYGIFAAWLKDFTDRYILLKNLIAVNRAIVDIGYNGIAENLVNRYRAKLENRT